MTKRKSELNLVFSTPIWAGLILNYQELNNKMLKYIKDLQIQNPKGITKSNVFGWHSEDFDLENEQPKYFINSISTNLNEAFIDMGWDIKNQEVKVTSMWSVINKKNASNARHIHSNNYISAAYYVKSPENSGDIVFHDPRSVTTFRYPKISERNTLNSNVFSIKPKEGLLVLFPSYLYHSVDFNRTEEERVVISFNINLL